VIEQPSLERNAQQEVSNGKGQTPTNVPPSDFEFGFFHKEDEGESSNDSN